MNRRRLLAGAGTLAGSLLAGCLGGEGPSGPETAEGTETETTTPTTTTTATTTATTTTTPSTRESTTATRSPTGSPPSTTTSRTRTTGSTTRSQTPSSRNAIVDRTIAIRDRTCGNPVDEGTVTFAERRVVVAGTITGNDSCTTAVFDEATYDATDDRLRIVVATERAREESTMCAQCLTEIDYEVRVEFAGRGPKAVVLVHRGASGDSQVTTATA